MTEPESTPAPKPTTPAAAPAEQKEPIKLPVALVVALVGAGLFIVGAFMPAYDGIPVGETPKLFSAMSGKVGIILLLVGVLCVAIKKLQAVGLIAVSLALGAVLAAVIDASTGDALGVKLSKAIDPTANVSGGVGMYAALFGACVTLLAVFMIPKKKKAKE